jgi:hypothetical protein
VVKDPFAGLAVYGGGAFIAPVPPRKQLSPTVIALLAHVITNGVCTIPVGAWEPGVQSKFLREFKLAAAEAGVKPRIVSGSIETEAGIEVALKITVKVPAPVADGAPADGDAPAAD